MSGEGEAMAEAVLIRNAAWAMVWDAAASRHVYRRGVDRTRADGKIAAIAPHAADMPPPAGVER